MAQSAGTPPVGQCLKASAVTSEWPAFCQSARKGMTGDFSVAVRSIVFAATVVVTAPCCGTSTTSRGAGAGIAYAATNSTPISKTATPTATTRFLGKRFIDGVPPMVSENRRSVGPRKLSRLSLDRHLSFGIVRVPFSRAVVDSKTSPGNCCVRIPLAARVILRLATEGWVPPEPIRLRASKPPTPWTIESIAEARRVTDILTYLLSRNATCVKFPKSARAFVGCGFRANWPGRFHGVGTPRRRWGCLRITFHVFRPT